MNKTGHLTRKNALGFRAAPGCLVCFFYSLYFGRAQEGEIAQEGIDIGIGRVDPELVKGIHGGASRIQPDCAFLGFPKLAAISLGDQGKSQAIDLLLVETPG